MANKEKASEHTPKVRQMMKDLVDHLKSDIEKIDNPQEKAIFETSAEVIGGLMKTLEHYEKKSEPAWS